MSKIRFEAHGHSMRWYEWVLMLLLLGLVAGVRAESVYKCTDAQGAVAFQAQPCPPQQNATAVTILPAPAHAQSPDYGIANNKPAQRAPSERQRRSVAARSEPVSYECRVADGAVFYRHGGCPRSIAATGGGRGKRGRGRAGGTSLSVSAHPIPRAQACAQIHRPGAIGRAGHEHDEQVSTYDHNLGDDPCH